MEKINEIKIPEGVDRIAVKQYDDKIVIEFIHEESKFKEGDFVYEDGRIMIVKNYPNNYYALIYPKLSMKPIYNGRYAPTMTLSSLSFRYATEDEKQLLIDAMEKDGKRWNAEKLIVEDIPQPKFKIGDKVRFKKGGYIGTIMYDELALTVSGYCNQDQNILDCKGFPFFFHEDWFEHYVEELTIEDIPQPKFKAGDEVRIKKGISSKTHRSIFPVFMREMDDYIGQKLVINNALWYTKGVYLYSVDKNLYSFLEDWFEPYVEELKNGDWAIFWDNDYRNLSIRLYHGKLQRENKYYDNDGTVWDNAVKWDGTKEQFEKVLRGEIN